MAYIVMADIVMAHIVMAHIVMATNGRQLALCWIPRATVPPTDEFFVNMSAPQVCHDYRGP